MVVVNSCLCSSFKNIIKFKSDDEYFVFEDKIKKTKFLKEISPRKYHKPQIFYETWYKCVNCGDEWRLIESERMFHGIWEPIIKVIE